MDEIFESYDFDGEIYEDNGVVYEYRQRCESENALTDERELSTNY